MAEFKIEGGKELEAALIEMVNAAGKSTSGKVAMRRALTTSGGITRRAAQILAPKLTGVLEQSIVVGTRLTRRQARMAKKIGKSAVEVHIGTADPAAIPQEFGTFKENAQPFMQPAWDQTQDKVFQRIGTEAWSELEKTAQRAARKAARLK